MHDHNERHGRRGHHSEHSRGGRGHGRHRARRGAIVGAVLTLLDERPMHGYELITELEDRSEGRWRPSAGTMYPALRRLADKELVTAEEVDGKRQFSLTDAGRERLELMRAEQGDDAPPPWEQGASGGRGDLRGSVAELMGQTRQIGRFGTPEQIGAARVVLDEAKRKLYAVLADAPTDSVETDAETDVETDPGDSVESDPDD